MYNIPEHQSRLVNYKMHLWYDQAFLIQSAEFHVMILDQDLQVRRLICIYCERYIDVISSNFMKCFQ